MEKHYFTRDGFLRYNELIAKVEAELRDIQSQIGDAYENGGDEWHDNFSFEQLTQQITMKSAQIRQLKAVLGNIKIAEPPRNPTSVCIGCTVKIKMNSEEKIITIGGYGESDPRKGILAYNTPLGKILMNLKKGAATKFNNFNIEIIEIL